MWHDARDEKVGHNAIWNRSSPYSSPKAQGNVTFPWHQAEHPLIPIESRLTRCKPLEWTGLEATTREIVLAMKKRRAPKHMPSQYVERFPIREAILEGWKSYSAMTRTYGTFLKVFLKYYKLIERFRWPRISFDAKTSTEIIQWMASGTHEALTAPFIQSQGIGTQDLRLEILDRVEVSFFSLLFSLLSVFNLKIMTL